MMKFEYKRQSIYIFLGLAALLFPFLDVFYLMLLFFGSALLFSNISSKSQVFDFLARGNDIKAGKLTGLTHLFLTTAVLLLISLMLGNKFPVFIIGGAFAIATFGDGVADIVNICDKANTARDAGVYSAKSSIVFLISGSCFALLAGAWISFFTLQVTYGMLIFLAVIGAITGALLESLTATEDNIVIPLGSAMVMWLFYTFSFSYSVDTLYLLQALVFSSVLGYLAFRARIADISAMLSATLLGVVIIVSSDVNWFFILLSFFFLGSLFTRYKYNDKLARGVAEEKKGVRGYKNVFSNSLAALSLSIAYGIFPSHGTVLLSAYLGSIATACGDTLASEIGETSRGEPRMITTLKKVRAGTDGGVSHLGEAAALFGSAVIALLAFTLIKNDPALVISVTAGGFIGTNIDSLLGATLQQKGYLSNNGVNLFATISGAIISAILFNGLVV